MRATTLALACPLVEPLAYKPPPDLVETPTSGNGIEALEPLTVSPLLGVNLEHEKLGHSSLRSILLTYQEGYHVRINKETWVDIGVSVVRRVLPNSARVPDPPVVGGDAGALRFNPSAPWL
jgi:hypothetical protein